MVLRRYFRNNFKYRDETVYEAIWYELGFIPNRFHKEFLQDVIEDINYQDARTVHKNGNYFYDAIQEDMTNEELKGYFWCDVGCIGKMTPKTDGLYYLRL